MISHIRKFWTDAEELTDLGYVERTILTDFGKHLQDSILLKRNERLYVAGWNMDDIVVVDCEIGKPFIRLSGNLKTLETGE